jgi:dihydrofolate synthase/folylpolyglutamate synthase
MSLKYFLNNKPIFYKDIKLKNMLKAWNVLKHKISLPYIIHLVGTNGKGSTGRFIANGLLNDEVINCCEHHFIKNHFSVVHFSSPHILNLNERIWLNGDSARDSTLDTAHIKLLNILGDTLCNELSYFEYITLICFVISDNKDYLVLEAGLGGELDATNVVKNNLSIITQIDYDHQEFLGSSIKQIATTKLISCNKTMLIAKQKHKKVYKIANKLSKKNFKILDFKDYNLENSPLPFYLNDNLATALNALDYLDIGYDISKLYKTSLFGRASKIKDNIILDVGHNPLGAKAIVKYIKQENANKNRHKKINLIYNSYSNKDYKKVLKVLCKITKKVLYIKINDNQMCSSDEIKKQCDKLGLEFGIFNDSNDNQKLKQKLNDKEYYLVFGSFKVAEEFLGIYKG